MSGISTPIRRAADGHAGVSALGGSFILPGLSDRIGRKPVMVVGSLLGIGVPLAALYWTGSIWGLGALLSIFWLASGTFPIFMATIPSETISARYVATTSGLVQGMGEIIGAGGGAWGHRQGGGRLRAAGRHVDHGRLRPRRRAALAAAGRDRARPDRRARSRRGAVAPMPAERLGFIGLGVMGAPMAGHLAAAGYGLTIFDIDRTPLDALVSRHGGVTISDSPKAVGAASDIVVTMLPSGREVRETVLGPDGLLEGLAPGALLLDTSSAEPWLTREVAARLAAAGIAMVDAPVSGAEAGAKAAELVFMVGGAEADVARARPLLELLGQRHFHLGPVGAGHAMKCINNTITAVTLMATTEGLVAGARYGLDPAVMNDVLDLSTGGSWVSRTQFPPAHLQPPLRRPVQAGADDEGHGHRRPGRGGFRARPPADGSGAAFVGGDPGRRPAGRQRQRTGARDRGTDRHRADAARRDRPDLRTPGAGAAEAEQRETGRQRDQGPRRRSRHGRRHDQTGGVVPRAPATPP